MHRKRFYCKRFRNGNSIEYFIQEKVLKLEHYYSVRFKNSNRIRSEEFERLWYVRVFGSCRQNYFQRFCDEFKFDFPNILKVSSEFRINEKDEYLDR